MMSSIPTPTASRGLLDRLFNARGVAFVGASEKAEGYSARIVRYCLDGGFEGNIGLVNPRHDTVFGRRCYPSLGEVPGEVDVVVAMVGPARIAELHAAAAARGTGYIVVIGELFDGEGAARERQVVALREQIAAGGPRIVGPVCVGVVAPPARLCMSISSALPGGLPRAGGIGLISQSGGIIGAVIDRSRLSGAGFSGIVSSGGEFDLGLCDYVEHMIGDPATRVIAVYCEGIGEYDRFLALAARARQADKAIILLKAGRSEVGARAALSHSGRIMGDSVIEEAVLRRHGIVLAEDIDDLHVTASVLARFRVNPRAGVAAASLSGGFSVVVGDALSRAGLPVAELAPETCARLRDEVAQPRPSNPVDAGARPTPGREALDARAALDALDSDSGVGATLYAETTFLNPETVVDQLAQFVTTARKPHITCWQAGPVMAPVVASLRARGVMVIESLAQTTAALRALYAWSAASDAAPAPASRVAAEWLAGEPGGTLESGAARRLLGAYGIALVDETIVPAADDPAPAAQAFGFPVVLKGIAPGIAHKTEHGLVHVGLDSAAAVREAAAAMRKSGMGLTGFAVQPLLGEGIEMIVGVKSEANVGAVVMLGFGGIFAEAMGAPVVEAAPFSRALAESMIDRVDRKGILRGYRTSRAYARDELAELLVAVSRLAGDERRRIAEIDLNPVIVLPGSVAAVDWLVVLREAATCDCAASG